MSRAPYNENVSSKYGAPMGRRSDTAISGRFQLRRVPMVDGDYDKGGAYWGGGGTPLYCAWNDDFVVYVRASSIEEAKRLVRAHEDAPGAVTFTSEKRRGHAKRARSYAARPRSGGARSGAAPKLYNATAEVTYEKQGGWKSSVGLRTLYAFPARSKAEATKIATEIYEQEPDYIHAEKNYDNVRMHLSVEEKY